MIRSAYPSSSSLQPAPRSSRRRRADAGARQVEPAAGLECRDAEFLARVPRPPGADAEPPVEDDRVLVRPKAAGEDRAHHLAQVLETVEPGLDARRRAPGTDFHVDAGRSVQQVVTRPLVVRVLEQLADHGQSLAPVLPELVAGRVGIGVPRLPELRDEGVPLVVLGQAEEGLDLLVAEQQGDFLGPLPVVGRAGSRPRVGGRPRRAAASSSQPTPCRWRGTVLRLR